MAKTKTKAKAASGTKAARGTAKSGSKTKSAEKSTAKAAKSNGKPKQTEAQTANKREAAAAQQEKMIEKVVKLRDKEKSWKEIGDEIGTTPGKAQYLMMLHRVAEGDVPKVPNAANPDSPKFAKSLEKARKAADEYSSWGWLSARSGLPEGKIKAIAEEAGFYSKGKENVAAIRAGGKDSGSKSGKKRGR